MANKVARERIVTFLNALAPSEGLGIAGDFWRWWYGELLLACGAKSQYPASSAGDFEISITREGYKLNPTGETGDLDEIVAALIRLKGSGRTKSSQIRLRLSPDRYVKRSLASIKLPRSTAQEMAELDVEGATPFSLAEIHICFEEDVRTLGAHRYFLVKRAVIEPLKAALANNGFAVSDVLVEDDGQTVQITGLSTPKKRKYGSTITALLVTATAFLTALSGALTWQAAHKANQTLASAIDQTSRELKELKPEFQSQRKTEALAHEMQARRDAASGATTVLMALTTNLPDETYIETLVLEEQNVTITGYSNDAPPLIAGLEDSPLLREVSFSGPTNKVPGKAGNRFEITARIEK